VDQLEKRRGSPWEFGPVEGVKRGKGGGGTINPFSQGEGRKKGQYGCRIKRGTSLTERGMGVVKARDARGEKAPGKKRCQKSSYGGETRSGPTSRI